MKKSKIYILILIIGFYLIQFGTIAQSPGSDKPVTNPNFSFDSLNFINQLSVGLKTGFFFHKMKYSADEYDYKRNAKVNMLFGITAEYKIDSIFSIKPDMVFIGKGVKIDNDDFNYELKAKYFDINIPVIYNLPYSKNEIVPFVLAGPTFGFARKGTITMNQNGKDYSTKVTNGNIKSTDFALRLGAGASIPIPLGKFHAKGMVEATYYLGLTNTFSKKEESGEAKSLNLNSSSVVGKRRNRGFELSFSLMIPLSEIIKPKVIIDTEKTAGPVIGPDTVDTLKPKPPIPDKPCYSINEIKEYMSMGLDVRGRNMCVSTITFEFNQYVLTKESEKYLDDNIYEMLNTMPQLKLKISGHTDNVGRPDYNLELSKNRAKSVYEYLIKKGISTDRLSFDGFGDKKPVDDNSNEKGRTNNRRVEFEVIQQ